MRTSKETTDHKTHRRMPMPGVGPHIKCGVVRAISARSLTAMRAGLTTGAEGDDDIRGLHGKEHEEWRMPSREDKRHARGKARDPTVCLWLRLRRKEKVKGTPRSPLKTTGKVTGTFTSLILWIY